MYNSVNAFYVIEKEIQRVFVTVTKTTTYVTYKTLMEVKNRYMLYIILYYNSHQLQIQTTYIVSPYSIKN